MKQVLFFGLISLFFAGCAVSKHRAEDNNTDNLIIWDSEKSLLWTDFKGHPLPEDINVEWSAVTISFVAYRVIGKHKTLVGAYFDRAQSWSVQQRDDLLKHEQYHFNITEIFARQMRKKIIEEKLKPADIAFRHFYSDLIKECSTMQQDYDAVTGHGKNNDQQLLQEKLIDKKLSSLDAYKNPMVVY